MTTAREALGVLRRQATDDRAAASRKAREVELAALVKVSRRPPPPPSWNGLHPDAFAAVASRWVRGGLPGASLGSGSRSAEKPMPHQDSTDISVERLFAVYVELLEQARQAETAGNARKMEQYLARLTSIESGVLPWLHMTPERWDEYRERMKLIASNLVGCTSCANTNCQRPVRGTKTDPLVDGLCKPCYQYRSNHDGDPRPKRLCEKDDARLRRTA